MPLPLPAEQAFAFEAIAGDGNTLLLRFTPAPRLLPVSRQAVAAAGGRRRPVRRAAAGTTGRKATPHRDEHFGDVAVYFDQVEVAVPVHAHRTPMPRRAP